MQNKQFENEELRIPMMANEALSAISQLDYPDHILKIISQVTGWMNETYYVEGIPDPLTYDVILRDDPERLFSTLSWALKYVSVLPWRDEPHPKGEGVVLSLGGIELEESVRLAIDYAILFSKEKCRRVWVISESWNPAEVMRYSYHIQLLAERGVSFRYILVTNWGWVEIPLNAETSASLKRLTFTQDTPTQKPKTDK